MSRGPEKVKEERSAKDEGNEDAGEDVVRGHADIGIVVLDRIGIVPMDVILRIDKVAENGST